MPDFKENVLAAGQTAVDIMDSFLKGEAEDPARLKYAAEMIKQGVAVERMNDNREIAHKRLAMSLVKHLPVDEKMRARYIELTNPEAKAPLLARPTE